MENKEEQFSEPAKTEDKKTNEKISKQVIALLIIVIILLSLSLLAVAFKSEIYNLFNKATGITFKYNSISYTKVNYGDLEVYGAQLSIYQTAKNQTVNYILYLRNDPRILDKIPSNVTNRLSSNVYLSYEKEPFACKESSLASVKLADFIKASGMNVKGAYANSDMSNNSEKEYEIKNCSNADKRNSVILIKKSDTNYSYVHQEGFCYVLETNECETIPITERLILSLMDIMRTKFEQDLNNLS